MITTTVEEIKKVEEIPVYHIDTFEVEKAKQMTSGVYLVKQSNLDDEVIRFYEIFKTDPQTKTTGGSITEIKFQEGLIRVKDIEKRRYVVICIDTTYGENYSYEQLKNVANANEIKYVNEEIGSVIIKLKDNNKNSNREYLTEVGKVELCRSYGNKCAMCDMEVGTPTVSLAKPFGNSPTTPSFEIDHIIPLACGGSNEIKNLQPLCKECHKQKTIEEKTLGVYKDDEKISYFNEVVLKMLLKHLSLKLGLQWSRRSMIDLKY